MNRKKRSWSHFLHKIRFRYKVTVLNENTLEEFWHIRLSRISVFLYTSLFVLVTFVLLTLLIVFTPLKFYLPGYSGFGSRSEIINESMQVDSLISQMQLQATYLEVLKSIISGEIKNDTLPSLDSVTLQERAELMMEKSKAEQAFVENFEREERFSLTTLISPENPQVFVFFKPTSGIISSSFNRSEGKYGISILTASNESVVSVLEGTVVYAAFTFDFGWVMHIQHPDNYLSIYKNNSLLLRKPGDLVKAGEVVAFTGPTANRGSSDHFVFQLWKQGQPINPEDVILF